MKALEGKIVLVTGASSGIGRACAGLFARERARLILAARRADRLEALADELQRQHGADVLTAPLDVRDRDAVAAFVCGLSPEWSAVAVLVNNAGLARGLAPFQEGKFEDWDEMLDTNVRGLLNVTRAVIPGMVERGGGDVVNIGSIAGHEPYPRGHVYCATKAAVAALSKGMRLDLVNVPVRVTEIAPGLVRTEFSLVRHRGDAKRAARTYSTFRVLEPEDVAEAVLFCVTRPPHVTVNVLEILPSEQASTMVHRETPGEKRS